MMTTDADPAREKLAHETAIAVCASVMQSGFKDQDQRAINSAYVQCRDTTRGFSDETLRRIKDTASDAELRYDLLRMVTFERRSEDYVLDYIALEPFRSEHLLPRIQGVLLSLDFYPDLAPQSDEARRHEQLRAIIFVTMHYHLDKERVAVVRSGAFRNTRLYIADERIRTLITTHENPGFLAELIVERDLKDFAQITGVTTSMAAGSIVLATGAL